MEELGTTLRCSDRLAASVPQLSSSEEDEANVAGASSPRPSSPLPSLPPSGWGLDAALVFPPGEDAYDTVLEAIGLADGEYVDSQELIIASFGRGSSCDDSSEDSLSDEEMDDAPAVSLEDLIHEWPPELLYAPGTRKRRREG
jgi:hypothetical protein